ncbi:LacI family transcriptional regulator [Luteococcus japonicus]|uniref:LacI family transcriptional regulator n=1 Tax=Luteococcus japonicus TaxID=33984 RepID=A0A3N1ZUX5_9ACTN|nr:LacI family DNA-binding transcriptional regulator [Luteococcus japonicus]ROR54649.1 LacI family transcriptional regulator [Luteococcus japonicus]
MATSGTSRPTIYDVAQEAGVSKSLVSLVLNDSPLVSDPKRAAVQRAIEKLGYRRSRNAASLARHRSHTVGLVVDDFENPWFAPLLHGLRETLAPHGLHVAIRDQQPVQGRPVNAIEDFLESEVDALVVAAEPGRDFDDPGVPTVVESTRLNTIAGADLVSSDQLAGARLAVDHLAGLGHREIGHVSGRGGAAATRCRGYQQGMEAHGLTPRIVGTREDTTEEGGYRGSLELLHENPQITAIFTANDTMAMGAWAALREHGHHAPPGVALVGYDNSPAARSHLLDLTTVDPRNHDVGVLAAETLLRRMADPNRPPEQLQVIPELAIRSSSGAARSAPGGHTRDDFICPDK